MNKYVKNIIAWFAIEVCVLIIYVNFFQKFNNINYLSIWTLIGRPTSWLCLLLPFIGIFENLISLRKVQKRKNLRQDFGQEFEKIYEKIYQRYIIDLEKKRIKTRNSILKMNILLVIVLIILILCILDKKTNLVYELDGLLISMFVMMGVMIVCILGSREKNPEKGCIEYESMYKEHIVKELLNSLNSNMKYEAKDSKNKSLIEKAYNKTEFVNCKSYVKIKIDDCVKGRLDSGEYLRVADIETIDKLDDAEYTTFAGIFAFSISQNYFKDTVIVSKEIRIDNKKVELDSSEFEKIFNVYSKDKILAIRILTPDIMELLVEFYKKYDIRYEISFKENTINFKFHTGPMFEAKISENSMDKETLFTYYSIFKLIMEVTTKVNKELQNFEV